MVDSWREDSGLALHQPDREKKSECGLPITDYLREGYARDCRDCLQSADRSKDEFLPGMKLAMEWAMLTSNSPRVAEIDERLEALQKELLKKANAKQGFEELADEIDSLREEKQDLLVEEANRAGMKQRMDELEAFLADQTTEVTEYDEGLVRQLIEKITVYDDHLAFEFKSGLETEVQM